MTLRDELDRAVRERDRLNVVIGYLELRLRDLGDPAASTNGRVTVAKAAQAALAEAGAPMRTADLVAAVRARGARLRDSDSLYKTLKRDPGRFRQPDRGLWELV